MLLVARSLCAPVVAVWVVALYQTAHSRTYGILPVSACFLLSMPRYQVGDALSVLSLLPLCIPIARKHAHHYNGNGKCDVAHLCSSLRSTYALHHHIRRNG